MRNRFIGAMILGAALMSSAWGQQAQRPATVAGHADFGIAYHEGDSTVASDDALGILSFRYSEPMSWW